MESKRLFSDEERPADQPQEQRSIDGAKNFFTADSIPVAEGEASDRCQKT